MPLFFGIDACLGGYHQIGSIILTQGPFSPGEAMNKSLPELGDYHLKAVVNYLDPLLPKQSLNENKTGYCLESGEDYHKNHC
ncbi:DUF1256 domain-containing protein [Peribacillus frigoritolerans]|nr:DUF1256 domain-containing protein [Peribacillus frigoritolerans]